MTPPPKAGRFKGKPENRPVTQTTGDKGAGLGHLAQFSAQGVKEGSAVSRGCSCDASRDEGTKPRPQPIGRSVQAVSKEPPGARKSLGTLARLSVDSTSMCARARVYVYECVCVHMGV